MIVKMNENGLMKKFYINGGLEYHYGQRVFLHVDYVNEMLEGTHCSIDQLPAKHESEHPVARVLLRSCVWGGADKFFGDWVGYEVTERGEAAIARIREVLKENGFEELQECPWR